MRVPRLNPYYTASLILIVAAVLLFAVAIITNQRDVTSAAVVISALVCLVTGIFLAALSGGEPLDTSIVGLLPVAGSISLARTCADLGIAGNAVILPAGLNGRVRTVQFNPVSVYRSAPPADGGSIHPGPDGAGMLTVPSGEPLMSELTERHKLVIPADPDSLPELIREVALDLIEITDRVRTERGNGTFTVTLEGYRLISGCRALAAESPRCCSTRPCPVCSLLAIIIAKGTGSVVQVERCSPDPEDGIVVASFSILTGT